MAALRPKKYTLSSLIYKYFKEYFIILTTSTLVHNKNERPPILETENFIMISFVEKKGGACDEVYHQ